MNKNATESGIVFDISRFCTHDGPGIRTTVFLKGCPLRCIWCHNPESLNADPEIAYEHDKCFACYRCMEVCPGKCHKEQQNTHIYLRKNCTACGKCAENCPSGALKLIGKWMTVQDVMEIVNADRVFYETSGGGMTISGGEPMFQPGFTFALAKIAKEAGIHVCIETSGCCDPTDLANVAEFTDLFLYDFKAAGSIHRKYTGGSAELILSNLAMLDRMGASVVLRCPMVPDVNIHDEHIQAIIETALAIKNIQYIDLEPYHPLGISKCISLDRKPAYRNPEFLDKSVLLPVAETIQEKTGILVNIS